MSRLHLDAAAIEREVTDLLAAYPELAEDEELRASALEGETQLHEVLARLVDYAQESACLASAIKERMAGLAARKAAAERREEAARKLIFRLMQKADVRKVPLPEATLSITTVAPSVRILDEALLPARFVRASYSPLKAEIKDALKAGEAVPGACLDNGGERLSVRVS